MLFESATIDPTANSVAVETTFLDGTKFAQTVPLHSPCVITIPSGPANAPLPADSDPASRKYWIVPIPRSSAAGEPLAGDYGYALTADCASGACN